MRVSTKVIQGRRKVNFLFYFAAGHTSLSRVIFKKFLNNEKLLISTI